MLLQAWCLSSFAQFYSVQSVEYRSCFFKRYRDICLSDDLKIRQWSDNVVREHSMRDGKMCPNWVEVPFKFGDKISVGTIFYKSGDSYEIVPLKKVGEYVIKTAKVRNISSSYEANMKGQFSYTDFFFGLAKGKVSGNMKGGETTVVNVVFTNGKSFSINAIDDPLWLEAQEGQKVEHYNVRHLDVYKLLF